MEKIVICSILNGVVCDSEADVEGEYSISSSDVQRLIEALATGLVHLRVFGSTLVSTPSFTITAIEASVNGTNFYTWITFGTAITCNAAGELGLRNIAATNVLDHRVTKLKFTMGGSAPDANNKVTLLADLVGYLPTKR